MRPLPLRRPTLCLAAALCLVALLGCPTRRAVPDGAATTTAVDARSAVGAGTRADDGLCQLTRSLIQVPVGEKFMEPICDGVYAEPGLDAGAHAVLRQAQRQARRNMARAFGELRGPQPLTFFCHSAACKVAFGASPAAAASRDLGFARDGVETSSGYLRAPVVFVTGPEEGTARILTHEWVHAEMKAWVPYDALPTWFNEGMATLVASEPSCAGHVPTSSGEVRQLETKEAWQDHISVPGRTLDTYCRSRAEVESWASRFGDPPAVAAALKRLLTTVADGGSFDAALGN